MPLSTATLVSPAPSGAVASLLLCAQLLGDHTTTVRDQLPTGRHTGPVSWLEYDELATSINAQYLNRGLTAPLELSHNL